MGPAVGPVEPQAVTTIGRRLGVGRDDLVPELGDICTPLPSPQRVLVLDHRQGREAIDQSRERLTRIGQQVEHQSHRHVTVAHQPDPGVDDAAVPFSAQHGFLGAHPLDHMNLADRGAVDGAAETSGDLLRDPRGGEVQNDRSLHLREPPLRGQRERQLLADVAPVLINYGKAVGIGVLSKSNGRARGGDDRGEGL